MWEWGRPHWCSLTCPRSTSKPSKVMGSASPGFPLMIEAFEGNQVETITFLPSLRAFQEALQFPEVTVAADTGMLSAW